MYGIAEVGELALSDSLWLDGGNIAGKETVDSSLGCILLCLFAMLVSCILAPS